MTDDASTPGPVGSPVDREVGRPVEQRANVGTHLKTQARRLLESIAAPCDTEKLIADLIRCAWEWGASCEVDDVSWGEAGDSHNQMWRDRTTAAATSLHAAMLASGKTPNTGVER